MKKRVFAWCSLLACFFNLNVGAVKYSLRKNFAQIQAEMTDILGPQDEEAKLLERVEQRLFDMFCALGWMKGGMFTELVINPSNAYEDIGLYLEYGTYGMDMLALALNKRIIEIMTEFNNDVRFIDVKPNIELFIEGLKDKPLELEIEST